MRRTEGAACRIRRVRRCAFWFFLIGATLSACGRSVPAIHLDASNPSRPYIEIQGLSHADLAALSRANLTADEWAAIFRVTVQPSPTASGSLPAMAGKYTTDSSLRFWPAFPLDPGRLYDVRFKPSAVSRVGLANLFEISGTVSLPASGKHPSTGVVAVYPTGDVIPANDLRMYIRFSAPMGQQGGLEHIAFVDDSGTEIRGVVLPLDTDLWNADRTRYTVILDPGRVKREILPNRQMGRPLRVGTDISIVVRKDWPDANGLPLAAEFTRRYRVGPPAERALATKDWHIAAPSAGTTEPVTVTFPAPLDFGLLQRSLTVSRGVTPVAGDAHIGAGETRWEFVPRSDWERGPYVLTVQPILEDLAGNRIGRAFEVLSRGDALPAESGAPVSVPFIVR
jgi:hypothetical protein